MQLATSPLQACQNTHSKPIRDVEHEAANVANNKTKANRDNPAAAVAAPTMEVGKTESTEATAPVVEPTPAAHSTAAMAVIPPKAPQTLRPQSQNSTIGTIAIPMAATFITTTQAPPVCNLVSITAMRPPGPT